MKLRYMVALVPIPFVALILIARCNPAIERCHHSPQPWIPDCPKDGRAQGFAE